MPKHLPILDPELVCSALIPPTAWLHVFAALANSIETADRLPRIAGSPSCRRQHNAEGRFP